MDDFFGIWVFDPTTAAYGEAPVPQRGVYALWPAGERIHFAVGWTDAEGAAQQTAFALRSDGEVHALPSGQQVRCAVEDGALITEVQHEGRVLAWASRTPVEGGEALDIIQRGPEGETRARYRRGRVKQVLCYRRDLNMRKGKIAAQCAHASLSAILRHGHLDGLELSVVLTPEVALWTRWRQAKIVLSVADEAALLAVHAAAKERGLPTALVRDAGLTEFGGVPTLTAVAVGPALATAIDAITGPDGLVATKLA